MSRTKQIIIQETAQELKKLFRKYPNHLHTRIQFLYSIKTGITDSTKQLALQLMVTEKTIRQWKSTYALGGLNGLLKYERGKNKSNSMITPEINKIIVEQLSSPTSAFTSYVDLYQWLKENHLENVTYRVVHHHTHTKLKASLKVARKSHIKKDEKAVDDFKKMLM